MKKNILSIDVENWHDGLTGSGMSYSGYHSRLEENLHRILHILQQKNVTATFFWLGSIAEKHKTLLREVRTLGHDIGCHGWSHTHLGNLGSLKFTEETGRAVNTIADITGEKVIHYRAPFFSVNADTPWALPTLARYGVKYDSSIAPVRYWRYGYPGFEPGISVQHTEYGAVTEVPVSSGVFFKQRILFGGGAWFRMIPFRFILNGLSILEKQNLPGVFYLHPWELDPCHPRIFQAPKQFVPHYWNLRGCQKRLGILLEEFKFASMSHFFREE